MRLTDILSEDRVRLALPKDGIKSKAEALEALAILLAVGTNKNPADVQKVLADREDLQSTGIGDGVAVPHGSMDAVDAQSAAVLLSTEGIDFDSIDDRPVQIVVGVLGPRRGTVEHLRMLATISRLLGDGAVRRGLLEAGDASAAFAVIHAWEAGQL